MKLYEIQKPSQAKTPQDLKTLHDQYKEWLEIHVSDYAANPHKYLMSMAGLIADADVNIENLQDDKFPFKFPQFSKVRGNFRIEDRDDITDWSFLPKKCGGLNLRNVRLTSLKSLPVEECFKFNLMDNKIKTLEGMPDGLEEIDLRKNPITSLAGVADHIKSMKGVGWVILDLPKIKRGGIGLIMIPGLKAIGLKPNRGAANYEVWQIINKYVGKPDQVFECQEELINAGFEEYAEL